MNDVIKAVIEIVDESLTKSEERVARLEELKKAVKRIEFIDRKLNEFNTFPLCITDWRPSPDYIQVLGIVMNFKDHKDIYDKATGAALLAYRNSLEDWVTSELKAIGLMPTSGGYYGIADWIETRRKANNE